MSLHALANNMASKGRGPDTMLVHMAPREVAGLQSLAMANGGSLTINPDTGLPEAGFLSSMLPMLIGAGLSVASGGTLTPMMAAMMTGGGYAAATGSLQKGLMAGLGAFGGAGLGGGLFAAGAEGVGASALDAGMNVFPSTGAFGASALDAGMNAFPSAGAAPAVSAAAAPAASIAPVAPTGGISNLFGGATDPTGQLLASQPSISDLTAGVSQVNTATVAPSIVAPPVAPVAPLNPEIFNSTTLPPAAPAAPSFTDNFTRAGRGIENLKSSAGRDAFMKGVDGNTGLLKYGAASLAGPLMEPPKGGEYKGSGPNPYKFRYDINRRKDPDEGYTGHPSGERRYFDPVYTPIGTATPMAVGGLTAFADGGLGSLGSYSDGGRLLKGPGDGVSDSIPATIGTKGQPARLADGEFVVPARIVSELGNGSTEAGARKLYQMMDRIQKNRSKTVGKDRVAVNSKAERLLPA